MKKLKIAMIGCAGIGRRYCYRYTRIEGAELAMVVDTNAAVAEEMAKELGGIAWSTDYRDALRADIDIIDISTPNFLHAEQTVAAIEANKHVLIQKPLAQSLEDAQKIADAVKHTDKAVGMNMSMFNSITAHHLRQMIADDALGVISTIHARNAHRGGLTMPAGTWRGDVNKCGGGSFIQLAIHDIDLIQWLLGSKIDQVSAFSHNLHCPNIGGDDATCMICHFDNGVLGTIESSYCSERNELCIYGTKGYAIYVEGEYLELQLDNELHLEGLDYTTPGQTVRFPCVGLTELYQMPNELDQAVVFVKAVLDGKPAPVSVETGLYDLRVVKAVYRSAQSGKTETVV